MSRSQDEKVSRETWIRFGLPAPETEVRVCFDRLWRVDFVWHNPGEGLSCWNTLAVEVHGGMWRGMAHSSSPKDFSKGHRVALNGWHRMEFTPAQVLSGYGPSVVAAFLAGNSEPMLPLDPEDRRKGSLRAAKQARVAIKACAAAKNPRKAAKNC
jgi:hypothetical protein